MRPELTSEAGTNRDGVRNELRGANLRWLILTWQTGVPAPHHCCPVFVTAAGLFSAGRLGWYVAWVTARNRHLEHPGEVQDAVWHPHAFARGANAWATPLDSALKQFLISCGSFGRSCGLADATSAAEAVLNHKMRKCSPKSSATRLTDQTIHPLRSAPHVLAMTWAASLHKIGAVL